MVMFVGQYFVIGINGHHVGLPLSLSHKKVKKPWCGSCIYLRTISQYYSTKVDCIMYLSHYE